ncbi:NADAR family protein [Xylanibacter rodentium]|uniref:NADAR family protein n=1 Tax=Xylanibacter rodentium TaxID=2736289 RepID=UPI002587748D|nr:NADAR family protein [Xylanibacter rodentium]
MEYTIQMIKDRFNSGESLEYIFFWRHHAKLGKVTKACFSQWFPACFVVDDVEYNCAEQYMMAEKARVFDDDDIRMRILASNDPKEIKALGRMVKNFDVETWNSVAPSIVVKGNLHKFGQNTELCRFILDTGNKVLVEASPYDTIWGIGMKEAESGIENPCNWKGTNFLGFALMEVRDILNKEEL